MTRRMARMLRAYCSHPANASRTACSRPCSPSAPRMRQRRQRLKEATWRSVRRFSVRKSAALNASVDRPCSTTPHVTAAHGVPLAQIGEQTRRAASSDAASFCSRSCEQRSLCQCLASRGRGAAQDMIPAPSHDAPPLPRPAPQTNVSFATGVKSHHCIQTRHCRDQAHKSRAQHVRQHKRRRPADLDGLQTGLQLLCLDTLLRLVHTPMSLSALLACTLAGQEPAWSRTGFWRP